MKKILSTLVAILATIQISHAQWSGPVSDQITTTNKVGIGTSTPAHQLDVVGNIRSSNQIMTAYGSFSTPGLLIGDGQYGMYVAGGVLYTKSSASGLYVWRNIANSDNLFTIDNNGNTYNKGSGLFNGKVGIGTQTPGSDLTILRNGSGISLNTGSTGYFGTIAFNRESQTGAIFNSAGNAFQINNGGFDANLHFQVYNGLGAAVNPDALTINGSNGGVGINTAVVPANYQFAVNGAAIVTSMTVKLYSAWPDYVFKKGYHLPTLSDVNNYIAKNNRLPDMPSEDQVAKDGINLGQIVTLQTKKIEELTLYLIEKDKQLKKQEDKINALEKQNTQLKNQQAQIDELKVQMAKLLK